MGSLTPHAVLAASSRKAMGGGGGTSTESHTHYDSYPHTLRYSTNRLMKPMKCSAFLMFPGMASACDHHTAAHR